VQTRRETKAPTNAETTGLFLAMKSPPAAETRPIAIMIGKSIEKYSEKPVMKKANIADKRAPNIPAFFAPPQFKSRLL